MIQFDYSKYTLTPLSFGGGIKKLAPRHGALIRVTWVGGRIGYSDLMPRSEFKEIGLDQELENLRKNKLSSLAEQMMALAKLDADVRTQGKNAFTGVKKVKNNYFITDITTVTTKQLDDIRDQGFSTLMIDIDTDLEGGTENVRRILRHGHFMVRIAMNSSGNFSSLERFMTVIEPGLRPRIEFMMDPFPFEPSAWREASQLVPLAIEREIPNVLWTSENLPNLKAIGLRPSRMDTDLILRRALKCNAKVFVTSSFEHPVGVAHAGLVAADLVTRYPNMMMEHDCIPHLIYAPHSMSGVIRSQGPYLVSTDGGNGIGFDQKLNALPWTKLK